MCLFPKGRLFLQRFIRIIAAKEPVTENAKLSGKVTHGDIVQLLELTKENQNEKVASLCNSLWKLPYEDQLRFKEYSAKTQMRRLAEIIQKSFVLPIIDGNNGLFRTLTFYSIVPSPTITGYRGKDGFVVNIGVDGDPATVGIPYGSDRLVLSIPPSETTVAMKPIHGIVCNLFQRYLRDNRSVVAPTYFDLGGYKCITVRSNRRADKIMVIVQLHRHGYKLERVNKEKRRLTDYFLGRSFSELPSSSRITSLYFRPIHKLFILDEHSNIFEHIGGEKYIEETVLGRTFRISPSTFFQINVDCAEMLFRTVIEQCPLDKDSTILLDIGCGAGIYSIVLSDHVKQSIGIDVNLQCIEDAETNAERNGMKNTRFIHGRLETLPPDFLDHLSNTNDKLVAILNPGRWGVKGDTVMALRRLKALTTLIYVSCYPYENAFNNFVSLLKQPDDSYHGLPFILTKAIPVDMFPQTPHYELVLLFQR